MLKRIAHVQAEETPALFWSFAYFFCLLCSYYILRPIRDEMGIQGGVQSLPWLFSGTLAVMLIAVPVFGWLTARLPRRRLLPVIYYFFVANLLIFFLLLKSRTGIVYTARAFFIWLSVFNLFVISIFWSFMVDLFTKEQAQRLFGFIAAGGSTGALIGPALAAILAESLGPANLLLVSASFLISAIICVHRLVNWRTVRGKADASSGDDVIGGGAWAGAGIIFKSPYLGWICLYMVLYTTLSTFLYLEQARIVADAVAAPASRTSLFASMDFAVNVISFLGQLFLTGKIVSRFGVSAALVLVPALTILGFIVLGSLPVLAVLVVFQTIRRAGDFVFARPAREMLFTVVSREAKYKSKNFIDTVVYRSGDAASGWLFAALGAIGLGLSGIALIAIPISAAWLATGLILGKKYDVFHRKIDIADNARRRKYGKY
ncbi:MAG TPA: MFS transporter [Acidiferrobacterales bacterium]|nr:MFS transporter [Acidiferrobacterales bacterium]